MSTCSSIRSEQRFTRLDDYERQVPHTKLYNEAQLGNLDCLHEIQRELGFVRYDPCIAQAALRRHQLKFWSEFVQLSKSTLAWQYNRCDARIEILTDLLKGYRGPELDLLDLFRHTYETLLHRPSTLEVAAPVEGGDEPDGCVGCSGCIGSRLERATERELEADICIALALHPPRPSILEYMVEHQQYQFKIAHLELAQLTFDRALVQYVRQHMHPDISGVDDLPMEDLEPNDSDLICMVMDAVRTQFSECGSEIIVRFLLDYPHMINRLYFLIDFLQTEHHILTHQEPRTEEISSPTYTDSEEDDEGYCDSDYEPEDETPGAFYRVDLAEQLLVGVVESSKAKPLNPIEAVKPSPMDISDSSPIAAMSPPPATTSKASWVESQLLRSSAHADAFIGDMVFMCRLVFILLDQVYGGLQRWDLVELIPDTTRHEPFRDTDVPNKIRLLSCRRRCIQDLRHRLIHQRSSSILDDSPSVVA